ncbi:MAG TPA: phenylalanine--tRNA ligase subunit beta [Candidatus Saccharimonadales bacterium]|nr:phenylalanine--tRNA ligase subunit beta [Candidatus Saccharimonadales bacterium]
MKVSLNIVKQFTDVDVPVDELVQKINQQLGGVEEVIDLGVRYKDAVIAKVVNCEKHPNADKLSVCEVDAGTGKNIQVVCGAPNVRAGIFVVWLPPASIVPSTFDDAEPFVLTPKELRGVMSNGMLASAKELAIGDDHDGILEIDSSEWKPNDTEVKPGASFAKAYGLDDTIIDIENKMFTHRPDLFGQLGVAREIAGIQHKQFTSPQWYTDKHMFDGGEGLALDVFNDTLKDAPRFMAVAVKDVTVKPSPLWLRCALVVMGSKPINNLVDVTNYVMLLTAQPTHAYDYDKLRGGKIGVRMARSGERVTLLNDKVYELSQDDIVIADGEGPVGLAGIMGGGESEVDENTKNIVLEVASFDMYIVRKSAMRHGVFTDALTRFNKGQSPLQSPVVLKLLMQSITDVAGGEQASAVFDKKNQEVNDSEPAFVGVDFINQRLGMRLTRDAIVQLLKDVEFDFCEDCDAGDHKESIHYVAPFWRTDIELPEDIVEEVGRLYGFDKLPRELPKRSITPAPKNPRRALESNVREALARAGANEVLTYSFVHQQVINHANQDVSQAFRLSNALSPDLQYYRLSLTPSLLGLVHSNIKNGYDQFALFELNKAHNKTIELTDENVPAEISMISLVVANKKPQTTGAAFYQAKKILEYMGKSLGLELVTVPFTEQPHHAVTAPFEWRRSAQVVDAASGVFIGIVGEYKKPVARNFKLPEYVAGFELGSEHLLEAVQHRTNNYTPISRFPGTERDICFQVTTAVKYAQIVQAVQTVLDDTQLETAISPVDLYQPADGDTKNITIRIKLTAHDRTLTGEEVAKIIEQVASVVIEQTQATIV